MTDDWVSPDDDWVTPEPAKTTPLNQMPVGDLASQYAAHAPRQTELRATPEETWWNNPRKKLGELIVGDSDINSNNQEFSRSRVARDVVGTDTINDSGASLADFTPAHTPLFAADARRNFNEGKYGEAALDAVAAIPIPFIDKGVKAVRGMIPKFAREAAAPTAEMINANRMIESGQNLGVDVPRVFLSGEPTQRVAEGLKNTPFLGTPISDSARKFQDQLEGAVGTTADKFGHGSGNNVARSIGNNMTQAANAETTAAQKLADDAHTQAMAQWESQNAQALEGFNKNQDARLAGVEGAEQTALNTANKNIGNVAPQEMGANVRDIIKREEQAAKARKDEFYKVAEDTDAVIKPNKVGELSRRVNNAIRQNGLPIEQSFTPAAIRIKGEIDGLAEMGRDGFKIPFSEIENKRKIINNLYMGAANDTDKLASRQFIKEYDNWLNDAFEGKHFTGSPDALEKMQAARNANRDWRTRFGYNEKEDADKLLNRIATGEVTEQEVADWIIGKGKVAGTGSSARLMERINTATKNSPEVKTAIRSSIWNRLSQTAEGVADKSADRVANDIHEFLNGSGRATASKVFDPNQRKIMSLYADTLRAGKEARSTIKSAQAPTITPKPKKSAIDIGPMQELADSIVNGRSDEALFKAIGDYAKSGGKGNGELLSKLVSFVPPQTKNNLAGAMIREMGTSPRTKNFSADVWLSNWRKQTPQAKALLYGMSGDLRKSLDDIASLSRLHEQANRFTNYSKTATVGIGAVAIPAFIKGLFSSPTVTLTTAVGGKVMADLLSKPATARATKRWVKTYTNVAQNPGNKNAARALSLATRALANSANDNGIKINPSDLR